MWVGLEVALSNWTDGLLTLVRLPLGLCVLSYQKMLIQCADIAIMTGNC